MADSDGSQTPASSGNPLVALQNVLHPSAAGSEAAPQAPKQAPAPEPYRPEDDASWIEKARLIIKRSKGDPFTRADALSKLKTQYLQQRFGKTISGKTEK